MKETSYLLGSHNSLTYLRPKKWWMRPFHFMARCQRASYKEQYEKYGVRVFDLRVWFTDNLDEEVRHGVMVFKATNIFIRDFLDYLNDKGDCHLRIILEEDNITKKDKKASMKEDYFKTFCMVLEDVYHNIHFFGGNRKWDWKLLYQFEGEDVVLDDKYSSTTSLFGSKKKWLAVLDDLWPWLYARLNNKKNRERGTDKECLFVDFVDL